MTLLFMPGHWMAETTGVLRPAVQAYLWDEPMTPEQIAAMRAYLRQWIEAPVWRGKADLQALRGVVDQLTNRRALDDWLELAIELGVDPL